MYNVPGITIYIVGGKQSQLLGTHMAGRVYKYT